MAYNSKFVWTQNPNMKGGRELNERTMKIAIPSTQVVAPPPIPTFRVNAYNEEFLDPAVYYDPELVVVNLSIEPDSPTTSTVTGVFLRLSYNTVGASLTFTDMGGFMPNGIIATYSGDTPTSPYTNVESRLYYGTNLTALGVISFNKTDMYTPIETFPFLLEVAYFVDGAEVIPTAPVTTVSVTWTPTFYMTDLGDPVLANVPLGQRTYSASLGGAFTDGTLQSATAWLPDSAALGDRYILDLGYVGFVAGVRTKGRKDTNQWTTFIRVATSTTYPTYWDSAEVQLQQVTANVDGDTAVDTMFPFYIEARYVEIRVMGFLTGLDNPIQRERFGFYRYAASQQNPVRFWAYEDNTQIFKQTYGSSTISPLQQTNPTSQQLEDVVLDRFVKIESYLPAVGETIFSDKPIQVGYQGTGARFMHLSHVRGKVFMSATRGSVGTVRIVAHHDNTTILYQTSTTNPQQPMILNQNEYGDFTTALGTTNTDFWTIDADKDISVHHEAVGQDYSIVYPATRELIGGLQNTPCIYIWDKTNPQGTPTTTFVVQYSNTTTNVTYSDYNGKTLLLANQNYNVAFARVILDIRESGNKYIYMSCQMDGYGNDGSESCPIEYLSSQIALDNSVDSPSHIDMHIWGIQKTSGDDIVYESEINLGFWKGANEPTITGTQANTMTFNTQQDGVKLMSLNLGDDIDKRLFDTTHSTTRFCIIAQVFGGHEEIITGTCDGYSGSTYPALRSDVLVHPMTYTIDIVSTQVGADVVEMELTLTSLPNAVIGDEISLALLYNDYENLKFNEYPGYESPASGLTAHRELVMDGSPIFVLGTYHEGTVWSWTIDATYSSPVSLGKLLFRIDDPYGSAVETFPFMFTMNDEDIYHSSVQAWNTLSPGYTTSFNVTWTATVPPAPQMLVHFNYHEDTSATLNGDGSLQSTKNLATDTPFLIASTTPPNAGDVVSEVKYMSGKRIIYFNYAGLYQDIGSYNSGIFGATKLTATSFTVFNHNVDRNVAWIKLGGLGQDGAFYGVSKRSSNNTINIVFNGVPYAGVGQFHPFSWLDLADTKHYLVYTEVEQTNTTQFRFHQQLWSFESSVESVTQVLADGGGQSVNFTITTDIETVNTWANDRNTYHIAFDNFTTMSPDDFACINIAEHRLYQGIFTVAERDALIQERITFWRLPPDIGGGGMAETELP